MKNKKLSQLLKTPDSQAKSIDEWFLVEANIHCQQYSNGKTFRGVLLKGEVIHCLHEYEKDILIAKNTHDKNGSIFMINRKNKIKQLTVNQVKSIVLAKRLGFVLK